MIFNKLTLSICIIILMLSTAYAKDMSQHHKKMELSCKDCHASGQKVIPTKEACLTCHGPLDELRDAAKQPESEFFRDTNPHYSLHYGDGLECSACHSEHKPAKIYCNTCHHNFEYPDFPTNK
ncbi:cytochrome c3 family protein [Shewanella frigidimarina]|uniref:cytochrome c3 family protein n=1 Tax=Shewanella frigidimarina TaxID=56812 RepID=UPI003D7AE470